MQQTNASEEMLSATRVWLNTIDVMYHRSWIDAVVKCISEGFETSSDTD